jgi:hypothetical protein
MNTDSLLGEYSHFICLVFRKKILKLIGPAKIWRIGLGGNPIKAMKKLKCAPFIISSASPVTKRKITEEDKLGLIDKKKVTIMATSPAAILLSVIVWWRPENDILRTHLFNYAKLTDNIWLINRLEQWKSSIPGYLFQDFPYRPGYLGKLALLPEPAGKVRVIAMVDCWTQWMMEPLFKSIAAVLRCLPQDGTENQTGPYNRLWERYPKGPFFCYDLSSATDRLPLVFQKALLSAVFGSWFAEVWGILLTARPYRVNLGKYRSGTSDPDSVYYATGQPMGAKSSFHMMAIFHHTVVQWAAWKAYPTDWAWFDAYCIVGDDIVISDKLVADQYLAIMSALGVKVGLHKSLVSEGLVRNKTRFLASEFIKRTYFYSKEDGVSDVSAIPITHWYMARKSLATGLDFCRRYSLSLNQWLILLGFGYKARGRQMSMLYSQPRRIRHRIVSYFSPRGVTPLPFVEWISLRSVQSRYRSTDQKLISLARTSLMREVTSLLSVLNSKNMLELLDFVKKLITVKRDREYYGTTDRDSSKPQVIVNFNPKSRYCIYQPSQGTINLVPSDYDIVDDKLLLKDRNSYYFKKWGPLTIFKTWEDYLKVNLEWGDVPFAFIINADIRYVHVPKKEPVLPKQESRINRLEDLNTVENNMRLGYSKYMTISDSGVISQEVDYVPLRSVLKWASTVKKTQWVLDQLIELVYRDTFSGVLASVRDIRADCEELIETLKLDNPEVKCLDSMVSDLWSKIEDFRASAASLPLPKQIYQKVESDLIERESKNVKAWEQFVSHMRSTHS